MTPHTPDCLCNACMTALRSRVAALEAEVRKLRAAILPMLPLVPKVREPRALVTPSDPAALPDMEWHLEPDEMKP